MEPAGVSRYVKRTSAVRTWYLPVRPLGVQECEDREHAPVIVGALGEPELAEDVRGVLLHRALCDHQAFSDPLVRAALGHQLEHLALARAQLQERVVPAAPPQRPALRPHA